MNAVADELVARAAAGPSRLRRALTNPVGLGLLLALVVTIGLTAWFHSQAEVESQLERETRGLVLEAAALADLVAAHQQSDTADDQGVARIADEWSTAGEQRYVRVLRLSGARLLASTFPTDASQELPRRLGREEKWLFDLAQEMRAAVDTNLSEGGFRREHVSVEPIGDGRLRISMPYGAGDKVEGIVQLEAERPAAAAAGGFGRALIAILVPAVAFFVFLLLMNSPPDPRGRPWLLWVIALVVLAAATWLFVRSAAATLESAYIRHNEALASLYSEVRERATALAALESLEFTTARDENRWDVDRFQRPLGLVGGDGRVNVEAARAAIAAKLGQLERAGLGNFALGAVLLSFVALGYARRLRETVSEYRYAYLYVTPAMAGMLILVFFPFAYGIALSFTGQTLLNQSQPLTELWVGFENYINILGDFDVATSTATGWVINYQNFYWTLFVTICWTVSNVTVGVFFGMVLALVLNTPNLKGKAIYRVLLILPWAIPNYITALIWKGLFHPQFGAINQAVQMFGGEPVAWFDSVFSAFMTGLVTNGWLSFPFMMVVILGGLQSISNDMYEAATVEGATRWQQFWNITLPLLKPTLVPAVILSVVWTFNMFNVIYLVSGGAPAGANEILITKAYKIAFEEYRYAYSAAYSVVIFLILLVYGVFQTRMTRATEAAHA